MTKAFGSEAHFHEIYLGIVREPLVVRGVFHFAGQMLSKAKIVENIEIAYPLAKALKKSLNSKKVDADVTLELMHALLRLRDFILDEVVIVSAFELYSKAILIKRQYIIHEIEYPRDLKTRQKKEPIRRNTYRAYSRRGETPKISRNTLSASQLLKQSYAEKIPLSAGAMTAIRSFNAARNLVHFQMSELHGINLEKLDAICELQAKISEHA